MHVVEVSRCSVDSMTPYFIDPNFMQSLNSTEGRRASTAFLKMLVEELHTDVTLEATEHQYIRAHRSVLASYSPVFKEKFDTTSEYNWDLSPFCRRGASVDLSYEYILVDMFYGGLEVFLYILYLGNDCCNVKNSVVDKHCIQLIQACHKYRVDHAVPTLTASVERTLTVENCWQYYAKLEPFYEGTDSLSPWGKPFLSCVEYLITNFTKVARSLTFKNATPNSVLQVTKGYVERRWKDMCTRCLGADANEDEDRQMVLSIQSMLSVLPNYEQPDPRQGGPESQRPGSWDGWD